MNRSGILSERGKKFSNGSVHSVLKRKKERDRIPSASPNSGIEIISEFSEEGKDIVTFAGNGSR